MDSPTANAALQGLKTGFQSALKAAEAVGTKVLSAATGPNAPPDLACVPVQVKFNKDVFDIDMDATRPASRFFIQVYLKTGVVPPRQKIIGFKGMGPLPVEIDLKKVGLKVGMKLQLIQMPPGQAIEGPPPAGTSIADATQRSYTILQQRVDALAEALRDDGAEGGESRLERVHRLSMFYEELGMKVDEMSGEGDARAVRKALVEVMNNLMDRVEEIKKAASQPAPAASTRNLNPDLGTSQEDALSSPTPPAKPAADAPKVACELNDGVAAATRADDDPPPVEQPRIDPLTGSELEPPTSPPLPPEGFPPQSGQL